FRSIPYNFVLQKLHSTMASNQCTRPVYHDKANTHNERSLFDKVFHKKDQYDHQNQHGYSHVPNKGHTVDPYYGATHQNQHGSYVPTKGHTIDPHHGAKTEYKKNEHKKNDGHSNYKKNEHKKNKNKNKDGSDSSSSDSESDDDNKSSKKRFFY
ncbi:hypothetical protein ABTG41_18765, partial [Acinetobacter baumannii]